MKTRGKSAKYHLIGEVLLEMCGLIANVIIVRDGSAEVWKTDSVFQFL